MLFSKVKHGIVDCHDNVFINLFLLGDIYLTFMESVSILRVFLGQERLQEREREI